jgi:hypothetical protein
LKSTPDTRKTAKLSDSLRRKLDMYGIAAATAGMSLAVIASPASAEVVFTPAHQEIGPRNGITLDLNRDGIPDFRLARVVFGLADSIGLIAPLRGPL